MTIDQIINLLESELSDKSRDDIRKLLLFLHNNYCINCGKYIGNIIGKCTCTMYI